MELLLLVLLVWKLRLINSMQYLFGPPTPYKFVVYYQALYSSVVDTVRCNSASDVDAAISGIEMDSGLVWEVRDFTGKRVTPEDIGSHQTEVF